MKLLLDTHAILWMVADDPRLTVTARRLITDTDDLAWSTASMWEIGIKLSLHRPDFQLAHGWERRIPQEMARNGIRHLDIESSHCAAVAKLPWLHRDPFDRMLVAQALCENRKLLGFDPAMDGYGVDRLW